MIKTHCDRCDEVITLPAGAYFGLVRDVMLKAKGYATILTMNVGFTADSSLVQLCEKCVCECFDKVERRWPKEPTP